MPSYTFSDYIPHSGQQRLHNSRSPEILVVSSIRSGKSFAIIHDAIVSAWNNPTNFGTLITAPTYRLVESVLERPIVSKLEQCGLLKDHSFSRHETTLLNGKTIYYRSLEDPDLALRGLSIYKAYIDEAAYCTKYAVDIVKGRLLTSNGQLVMITTPNGTGSWLYQDYIAEPKDGVDYIKFCLTDNPIISEEAINRLRNAYDPLLAKQELDGQWVNLFRNQVYYSFSEENITDAEYIPSLPVYIGLDFNIDKNAWVAIQKLPDNTFRIIDEGYGARTTADAARQIIDRFGSSVIIVPDATGGNRLQGTATTNFQLLRQAGLHSIVENRSNPLRLKRYSVVNAALLNALGQRRLFVDRRSKRSIQELRELVYLPGTNRPDDRMGEIGHTSDAIGYCLMYLTGSQVGQIITPKSDFVNDFRKRKLAAENFIL